MTQQIPVRVADAPVAELDRLIAAGRFASRSEALREGLDRLLAAEREQAIEDAYRRARQSRPEDDGALGLAALAAWSQVEGGEPL